MKVWKSRLKANPSMQLVRMDAEVKNQAWIKAYQFQKSNVQSIITIPVVVHVLYNNQDQNISDAQIFSQIARLNADYRKKNLDTLAPSHPFAQFTADSKIEFCLASRDANGNATNGITRTSTFLTSFDDYADVDSVKYAALGGADNWDPTQYLNIWVCNIRTSTVGYATFPEDLANYAAEDGVVIAYNAFGSIGTAEAPLDLGRTASHEVGHWLNLNHIWGDDVCGDDLVADTEPAESENYGCETFPFRASNTCGSDANGEMFMNYMDYSDDACAVMFTSGQSDRMVAALNQMRPTILNSLGCTAPNGIAGITLQNSFEIYPNPAENIVTIKSKNGSADKSSVRVYNLLGAEKLKIENVNKFPVQVNTNDLSNGIYYFKITEAGKTITKKVLINK